MSAIAPVTAPSRAPAGDARPGVSLLPGSGSQLSFRALLLRSAPARPEGEVVSLPRPAVRPPVGAAPHTNAPSRATDTTDPGGSPTAGIAEESDSLDPRHPRRGATAPPDPFQAFSTVAVPASLPAMHGGEAASNARAAASLDDLVPSLVRRIAWSGDRRRATMRLEIGAGALSGATLLVHAEAGRVRVHLDVPPGVDAQAWQRRIERRLASRGVATDSVEVT
jgi:hypothetical protein